MLKCENYMMFCGVMRITPKSNDMQPYEVEGTWLYKPEYACWYCKGSSYPKEICSVVVDNTNIGS